MMKSPTATVHRQSKRSISWSELGQRQRQSQRLKSIIFATAVISIFVHIAWSIMFSVHFPFTSSSSSPSLSLEERSNVPRRLLTAQETIRRSYRDTFGALSTEISCGPNIGGKECIDGLLSEAMTLSSLSSQPGNGNATSSPRGKSFPWWFITMLRDVNAKSGVHGGWHNLAILDPPIDLCTIEKVATTEWRSVQCYLNEGIVEPLEHPRPCHLNKTALSARDRESKRISRVVMLRDPLERLLSGYLNKCVHNMRRKIEGHCEPMSVFDETDLTLKIRQDPKQLFAAYVDGFPLKWNVHFFPQSVYCDGLFRHVDNYDFIGHMDKNFFKDLKQIASLFGKKNKLPEALEKVFRYSHEVNSNSEHGNVGTETQAPMHVKEYYTAASVRRALEYFAVDYVTLGLNVPDWVHEILAEDNDIFQMT